MLNAWPTCSHVSGELRAKHPEIPWSQIVGMRNRVVHGYFAGGRYKTRKPGESAG